MVSLEVWVLAGMGCVGIMNNDNNIHPDPFGAS